jgi:hypothetical protein
MPAPDFLSFILKGTNKIMRNIYSFYIQKTLDGIVLRLKNGTLLVEVFTEKQAKMLLGGNLHGSYPVVVETHSSLNFSQGVVSTDSLSGMLDEEIQSSLTDHSISEAFGLVGKRDDKPFPVRTVFLTFEAPTLSIAICVGYEKVSVCPYIPYPMQCFHCQRFIHTQQ